MTPELRRVCTASYVPWQFFEDRVPETVEVADVLFVPGVWPKQAPPLRYVALRFSPKQGELFAERPKHLAVVSNRWDLSLPALVRYAVMGCQA
jgi:hypothetical protein